MSKSDAGAAPWHPMTDPVELKTVGKAGEEVSELATVCFRAAIQGIDGINPDNGKVNRQWMQEEIADVYANLDLLMEFYGFSPGEVKDRAERKKTILREWHKMA